MKQDEARIRRGAAEAPRNDVDIEASVGREDHSVYSFPQDIIGFGVKVHGCISKTPALRERDVHAMNFKLCVAILRERFSP